MIVTTTDSIEGRKIVAYKGIVAGECILGSNIIKDFFAGIRDVVGGRSGSYEKVLADGREIAMRDMMAEAAKTGANAIIGVDLDYEVLGKENGMLMVCANGTAVVIE